MYVFFFFESSICETLWLSTSDYWPLLAHSKLSRPMESPTRDVWLHHASWFTCGASYYYQILARSFHPLQPYPPARCPFSMSVRSITLNFIIIWPLFQTLDVPMEEDVLSDVVPSNIVSRQVCTHEQERGTLISNNYWRRAKEGRASTTRAQGMRWK